LKLLKSGAKKIFEDSSSRVGTIIGSGKEQACTETDFELRQIDSLTCAASGGINWSKLFLEMSRSFSCSNNMRILCVEICNCGRINKVGKTSLGEMTHESAKPHF
jgi:hypothetical protein